MNRGSRTDSHHSHRGLKLLPTAIVSILVIGCGALNLTGGSVSNGTSSLQGRAVRADNPSSAISSATMTLSIGSNSATYTTNSVGNFVFSNIAGGSYTCAFTPPQGSGLAANWVWPFNLPNNTYGYMVAAIWPQTFDTSTVKSVTVAPSSMTLNVGQKVRFVATAYDVNNQPIPLTVSLLLLGHVGTLDADGTFVATTPGSGQITAWMAGSVAFANVTVVP